MSSKPAPTEIDKLLYLHLSLQKQDEYVIWYFLFGLTPVGRTLKSFFCQLVCCEVTRSDEVNNV